MAELLLRLDKSTGIKERGNSLKGKLGNSIDRLDRKTFMCYIIFVELSQLNVRAVTPKQR